MSTSAFDELTREIEKQRISAGAAKMSRSSSIPDRMDSSSRRALYGSLPFTAMFGMQTRETQMRRVLSSVVSLESLGPDVVVERRLAGEDDEVQLEDLEMDHSVMTIPLIMAVLTATSSQFLVGYNTSVMNGASEVVFPDHSVLLWSIVVASFAVGGPFGAIGGGILANKRGRRGAMMFNAWVFLVGGITMALAPNVYWLIPARLICGFASGLASVVVPVYLGEVAPPTLRGALGTLTQFALVIGILVSIVFSIPLLNVETWRFQFAVTPILAVVQLLISPFLLESPRWLVGRNRNSKYARVVIKRLRGLRSEEEVEYEAQNYIYAHDQFKTQYSSAHSMEAYWDLLTNPQVRLLLVSAILLQMAQQLCGINAVFYYSSSFFGGTLHDPRMGSAIVALVNVVATYVALKLMDTTARRTLLIVSSGGMLVSAAFVIAGLLQWLPPWAALLAVMSFVSFFEIGLGPIPWLIVAEMFDAKYVATAMSISCIVNWSCNFLVGVSFPTMHKAFGPMSFVPFMVVLLITLVYVIVELPETHGRTLEEVQRLARSSALKIPGSSRRSNGLSSANV